MSETTPEGKTKKFVPQAPFSLSKSDLSIGNNRALSVKTLSGTDWRPCWLFHKSAFQMKSVLASGILLKFCIRGLLGDTQRKTLYKFCDMLSLLAAEGVTVSELDSLEYRVHRVLSLLERDFPVSLHIIVFHLLHHLLMFIWRFGPTYGFWMWKDLIHGCHIEFWIECTLSRQCWKRIDSMNSALSSRYLANFLTMVLSNWLKRVIKNQALVKVFTFAERLCVLINLNGKQLTLFTSALNLNIEIDLYSRYEAEKWKAKTHRPNKQFPQMSQWTPKDDPTLSETEMNLRSGPTDVIFIYNSYILDDKHGRAIKYGSHLPEETSSFTNSSMSISVQAVLLLYVSDKSSLFLSTTLMEENVSVPMWSGTHTQWMVNQG